MGEEEEDVAEGEAEGVEEGEGGHLEDKDFNYLAELFQRTCNIFAIHEGSSDHLSCSCILRILHECRLNVLASYKLLSL